MSKLRTFVAIEMPVAVKQSATQAVATMQKATESVRWVSTDQLHLTLKFLGDVEDRDIYSVCQAAQRSVVGIERLSIECGGIGAFPSIQKPRIIWFGAQDPSGSLTRVFTNLEGELSGLGFPKEPRRFAPHITLGRVRHGRRNLGDLTEVLNSFSDASPIEVPVDELTVFTSELHRSGPVYTVVGRAPLDS
ncbi:MAG: RNA 2',3'-cyclic phosphodiesterase [Planctomycetales bacterium]|nr:RNA 2',3'-cyclic phosphodiesterase [Planctomycetales bacterium]